MVNITFLEVHLDDASFSADRPFSPGAEPADDEQAAEQDTDDDSSGSMVPTKTLAALGVLLVLVGLAAVVNRLKGGDEPDVEIETPEDDENRPVGVTVDE